MSASAKRIVLILLVAATVYLAGNARVGLWDRDEPRYAQCSRQMLQSGDWVVPRLYDKLRTQKPPLIYWCQAAAMSLFGSQGERGAFSARVPSVLAMLGTLALLAIVLTRHSGGEQAMWTVLVMAASVMSIVAAKMCLTDSVLILFITAAQLCVFSMWRGDRRWSTVIILAIMLGVGGLTKGPFIAGILAATLIALWVFDLIGSAMRRRDSALVPCAAQSRSHSVGSALRTETSRDLETVRNADPTLAEPSPSHSVGFALRTETSRDSATVRNADPTLVPARVPGAGTNLLRSIAQILVAIIIIAAIVTPWLVLVHHRAPTFLSLIFKEAEQHAIHGKEGHHFPPGYHLLMVWPMFMPWSLLLPLAIGVGIQSRKIPEIRYALAAVVGPWIMVEFIGTKLPHYFLAAYPALAYLTAFAIRRCLRGEDADLRSKLFLRSAIVWALVIAAVGWLPWLAAIWFRNLPWTGMILLTIASTVYAGYTLYLLFSRRYQRLFWSMGLGMLATIAIACTLFAPYAGFLRISIHVADVLKRQGAIHLGDVVMVDYKEPSLDFYQGGAIREEPGSREFMQGPLSAWPKWVVMTREIWKQIPESKRPHLEIIDSYKGWAYADRGRIEDVMVVRNLEK